MRRKKTEENKDVFALKFSFYSSDNDSELSFSLNEDVPEIIEGEFIPYNENLEPVATQEETAAYEENSMCEEDSGVSSCTEVKAVL